LIRNAACPVIVVPNGVAHPLDALFDKDRGRLPTASTV
jgi:hypothetical protein